MRLSGVLTAKQTARTAFLMEIDPLYCDVMVRRWEQFTGRARASSALGMSSLFLENGAEIEERKEMAGLLGQIKPH